ncbi:hypothetical protein BGW42_007849 [Actinomortierella wolfii]|nr:hypothetical protein BGW42_007849 [Actinomortierella wolfii]
MADDQIEIPPTADEAQLLQYIYTETSGPRKGIFLTFLQAKDLLTHHRLLPSGARLVRLVYVKRGFNNRVYLATCTDGAEFVIRLGGRYWDRRKIINEWGALHLAQQALGDLIRVPKFLATSAIRDSFCHPQKEEYGGGGEEKTGHKEYVGVGGHGCTSTLSCMRDYVIMDRLPGIPLDTVWQSMSVEDKKVVVDQVIEIFARLQSIPVDKVGNFIENTEDILSQDAEKPLIVVGPLMEAPSGSQTGPYDTWSAFVASNLRQEIQYMLKENEKFSILQQYLPRLEALITKVEAGLFESEFSKDNSTSCCMTDGNHQNQQIQQQGREQPQVEKEERRGQHGASRPIRFMHGDFESRNMLVDGTKLTGLLDFEFAGAFPAEQEWCQSLKWLFARAEDPFDVSTPEMISNMTEEERVLRDYFYNTLEERYGIRPIGRLAIKEGQMDETCLNHKCDWNKVVNYCKRLDIVDDSFVQNQINGLLSWTLDAERPAGAVNPTVDTGVLAKCGCNVQVDSVPIQA